jgi:hypothetical protein
MGQLLSFAVQFVVQFIDRIKQFGESPRLQKSTANMESKSNTSASSESTQGPGIEIDLSDSAQVNQLVQHILNMSRRHVDQGDRDAALGLVIQAIRLTRGEEGVLEVLTQAREAAERGRESHGNDVEEDPMDVALRAIQNVIDAPSLLGDRQDGSEEILRDAFQDGSSIICKQCGGLVKGDRWEAHRDYWCDALPKEDNDD